MTPDETRELEALRQRAESEADRRSGEMSAIDYLRLDALEEKDARDRSLVGRFRGAATRGAAAVRILVGRPAAPPVAPATVERSSELLDPIAEETDEEQALRIHGEYVRAVGQFKAQRDEWRAMFHASWPRHLAAQRMLERFLRDGRAELALLATVASKIFDAPVTVSPMQAPDAPPAGLADAYECAMRAAVACSVGASDRPDCDPLLRATFNAPTRLASLSPDVDVDAELRALLASSSTADVVSTRLANKRLFALIRTIEVERDIWNARCQREQALHIEAEAHLQAALGSAGESHGRMLDAVNKRRALQQKQAAIRTREDLVQAAAEAAVTTDPAP